MDKYYKHCDKCKKLYPLTKKEVNVAIETKQILMCYHSHFASVYKTKPPTIATPTKM